MKPDIDLMQYADGELTPEERAELEAEVAKDPTAAAKLRAIAEQGELVRSHLELAADQPRIDARFARMWTEIDKAIEREAAPAPKQVAKQVPVGLWGRITRWIDTYRGHVLTGALSAGAVAAIALVLRPTPQAEKKPVVAEGSSQELPTVGPGSASGGGDAMVMTSTPAEVESLEVPGGTGTVFTIQGEDGEETTVIWVTPDDTLEGI